MSLGNPFLVADLLPVRRRVGILGKASLLQDVSKFPNRTSGCLRWSGLDQAARYFYDYGIVA